MATERPLRVGFLVNPVAGAGGERALKGSDDLPADLREAAMADQRAAGRAEEFVRALHRARLSWCTWGGPMGADLLERLGLEAEVCGHPDGAVTSAADTHRAARTLAEAGADIVVFVGGDGTARDVCSVLPEQQLCLGVPAGVKMQSGVFGVTPADAAEVLRALADGRLLATDYGEVRDIDEARLRRGQVRARLFGHLRVPRAHQFVQHVKEGGREREDLVLVDLAADLLERMDELGGQWILGPGSTTMAIKERLAGEGTLLGVDIAESGKLVDTDVEADLLAERLAAGGQWHMIVTPIGGQGLLFGRGNQQITPDVIRSVGMPRIFVVATRTKLLSLAGRPLRTDTGDVQLDRELAGVWDVITGYQDTVAVRVGREV